MSVKYIAVPVDEELLSAIRNGCMESGLKVGPEAARRLRKSYRVGFFAQKRNQGHEDGRIGAVTVDETCQKQEAV